MTFPLKTKTFYECINSFACLQLNYLNFFVSNMKLLSWNFTVLGTESCCNVIFPIINITGEGT